MRFFPERERVKLEGALIGSTDETEAQWVIIRDVVDLKFILILEVYKTN